MATEKLYSIAGVSTLDGDTKIRFANDVARIKILVKNGHTDIKLIELPEAMTKFECVKYLANDESFQDSLSQEAINEYFSKNGSRQTPAKKAVDNGPAVHTCVNDTELAPF